MQVQALVWARICSAVGPLDQCFRGAVVDSDLPMKAGKREKKCTHGDRYIKCHFVGDSVY